MSAGRRTPVNHGGRGGPSVVTFFFWVVFLVTSSIAYLWTYNQTHVISAALAEKREAVEELSEQNREIEAQIAELSSYDRITTIARNELNMVAPAAESLVVYIGDGLP